MLDQNLHKNHSFSTFVLLPMTEQNTMIIDTEVEALHETTLITKNIHKTDTVLHLEIETDFVMTKVLLLHTIPDQDMIHTNVILDLTVLLTYLLIDPHIDKTLVLDTDHAPIQEITNSPNTQIQIDHLQDQETLDSLDLAHTPIPEIKLIRYNNKTKLTLSNLKYTCITQQQWQMLSHLQVGFIPYMYTPHQL